MAEYRLQGLSCANCAREIEEEIQKLDHGKEAKVLFNSSKLIVSDDIAMHKVEKILAGEGAALVKSQAGDSDEHDHSHGHGRQLLFLLGISAFAFSRSDSYRGQLEWNTSNHLILDCSCIKRLFYLFKRVKKSYYIEI